MTRYTEAQIIERLEEIGDYLSTEYHPDSETELDSRLIQIDIYLAETVRLSSDALFLKGEAELSYIQESPSKIKMYCHNEYRLVEIVDKMEKTLTKAHNSVITQISKWKEAHFSARRQNN